ncbi:MAG: Hsp20/alpha crystallin family protein [Thiogranum sp.]|nr:Hsp20/alpha crystallin family protein [Thiogranum sp.]
MSATRDVAKQESKAVQETREQERAILPAVDIFEDSGGLTLKADMPGVSSERLDVQVDGESLSIEGKVEIPVPEQMNALYADIRSTRYQRSFSLSSELDPDNIEASLKDGVLTLRIPKREEHRPRRIEVQTA